MKILAFVPLSVLVAMAVSPRSAGQSETQPATSIVEGRVVHEPGGEPIRKVVVQLFRTDADARQFTSADSRLEAMEYISSFAGAMDEKHALMSATDAEGHFRIEKVPAGNYMVALHREGFVSAEAKSEKSLISVADGQNLSDLAYKMSTAGLITGKIVDADGDPIAGLAVQAIPKSEAGSQLNVALTTLVSVVGATRALPRIGWTNDLGEFRITGLRPGLYLVVAQPSGGLAPPPSPDEKKSPGEHLLYGATYYPGVLDQKQATPLEVSAGAKAVVDFTLQLHRAFRVSGTVSGVVNATGSYIILLPRDGRPQQQPLQEGGKFEFPSLEPGRYFAQVMIAAQPEQAEAAQMLSVPTPIVVNGSDLTDLVLQPLPHGKVSGRCRADSQDPVEWKQISIMLMPVSDPGESSGEKEIFDMARQIGSGPVNDDGTFEINGVVPGKYQLAVLSPSEKYRDWYLKSLLFAGQEVADSGFGVGDDSSLEVLVSPKGASITGTVVDSAGKPAPNAFVASVPSSGKLARPDAYQSAKTDATGKFLIRGMNPGDFEVVALEGLQQDTRSSDFYQKYGGKGTNVSLAEGDQKTVTLTLASGTDKR